MPLAARHAVWAAHRVAGPKDGVPLLAPRGGCHLNRKMDELIAAARFRIARLQTSYLPGPRTRRQKHSLPRQP